MKKRKKIPRVFCIVVIAAIVREETILCLQRRERKNEKPHPGLWELPKGKREFNETSIEALVREVKEETGLSIREERPISVFEYVVETPNEIRDTTKITFLASSINPQEEVKINPEEHQAARWFNRKELLSLHNITEDTRKSILEALEK